MSSDRSEQINELATALAKAQGQLAPAIKDRTNPAFKSKYADLASVWDACRDALSTNGLSIVQMPVEAESGRAALHTLLLHSSGQYLSSVCSVRLVKDDAPGYGSALTYLRRYALAAMVGIVADDDDDGQAASQRPQQRQPQNGKPAAEPEPQTPPRKTMLDRVMALRREVAVTKMAVDEPLLTTDPGALSDAQIARLLTKLESQVEAGRAELAAEAA